jgi:hypothetical protein
VILWGGKEIVKVSWKKSWINSDMEFSVNSDYSCSTHLFYDGEVPEFQQVMYNLMPHLPKKASFGDVQEVVDVICLGIRNQQ